MITQVSDHKGRQREVRENMEPMSEFLASLCPLVDASGLASGGKFCFVTSSKEPKSGGPSPHLLNGDNKSTYLFGLL